MYFEVTDIYHLIGQKKIPSKCPDCGNQDCQELNFYQIEVQTFLLKTMSKKITGKLICQHTQSEISPVLWTDEIEKRFENEKSKLQLLPKKVKINKRDATYLLIPILFVVGVIGYAVFKNMSYANHSEVIGKGASIGDKVSVIQTLISDTGAVDQGYTWYQITSVDGDTLYLKQHEVFSKEDDFNFDLDNANFTGETIKTSQTNFKERKISGFDYTASNFSGYISEIKKQD